MNRFDDYIYDHISQEDIPMPKNYHANVEQTLKSLPERTRKTRTISFRPILSAAAAFAFVFLMLLPNASPAYAQAVENIPVIGALVEVFTIRNYTHEDDRSVLEVQQPAVSVPDAPEAQDLLNADVDALIRTTVDRFYQDLEAEGLSHSAVTVDYEVVTNTDTWFTLQLYVEEVAASGHMSLRCYHIDRTTGRYVTLTDLFTQEGFAVIEAELRAQMAGSEDYQPEDVTLLAPDQCFRFLDNGDLLIIYDEAYIAPAFMGTPSFTIPSSVFEGYRK